MAGWLRRLRGALGMGLTWAVGWAGIGLLIGVASVLLPGLPFWDAFFDVFDAPLPALALPGFFGGVLFSTVLRVAGRRRRFDELSLPRFTAWGAAGGLLLSLLPAAMVLAGLASTEGGSRGIWELTAVIMVPLSILGAGSAAGTLLLARRGEDRGALHEGVEADRTLGPPAGRQPDPSGTLDQPQGTELPVREDGHHREQAQGDCGRE